MPIDLRRWFARWLRQLGAALEPRTEVYLPPSWSGEGIPRDVPREELPDWGEGYTTSTARPQPGQ